MKIGKRMIDPVIKEQANRLMAPENMELLCPRGGIRNA
jgi:hypothetical protein